MKAVLVPVLVVAVVSSSAFARLNRETPYATLTLDGIITPAEKAAQLAIPFVWPDLGTPPNRGNAYVPPASPAALSATIYLSWDDDHINWSAEVLDDTPVFHTNGGNVEHNGQDTFQPCFNPHDTLGVGGTDMIWDIVVDTNAEAGPDIYARDPEITQAQYDDIILTGLAGTKTGTTGYILEAAIPWEVAMDDATYVPTPGDVHGMSFILVSYSPFLNGFLTDWPADPWGHDEWNYMTLLAGPDVPGDANGDGKVTDADYTIWADTYNSTTDLRADWNDSGDVTDADYTIWADNYGVGTSGAVPEPATLAVLAIGGVLVLLRRRR